MWKDQSKAIDADYKEREREKNWSASCSAAVLK